MDQPNRPTIVVLCGSTRFTELFREANLRETLAGKIVLSVGCDTKADTQIWPSKEEREGVKAMLDRLHLKKIELGDEILVLDGTRYYCPYYERWLDQPGMCPVCQPNLIHQLEWRSYIGDSTRREIEHATILGKRIRYHSREQHDKKEVKNG